MIFLIHSELAPQFFRQFKNPLSKCPHRCSSTYCQEGPEPLLQHTTKGKLGGADSSHTGIWLRGTAHPLQACSSIINLFHPCSVISTRVFLRSGGFLRKRSKNTGIRLRLSYSVTESPGLAGCRHLGSPVCQSMWCLQTKLLGGGG